MRKYTLPILLVLLSLPHSIVAQWSLTGNAGTNASTNFIGTTDAKNFKIRTNNAIRVNITSSGKIGIGNFSPIFKLDVKGGSINTDSVYRIGGNTVLSIKGSGNTFTGSKSGFSNTTGANNTATGSEALTTNNTGSENLAFGQNALRNNTTGYYNLGIGNEALYSNQTESFNIAIGYQALSIFTSGESNTAIGQLALRNLSNGNANIAIGYRSGHGILKGNGNVLIGKDLAFNTTNSYDNTLIGGYAAMADSIYQSSAIGYGAYVLQSTSLVLGDTNLVKVGIGTGRPKFKLDVKLGSINTDSLYRIKGAKVLSSSGAGKIQIGESNSKVGIGISNPTSRLHVEGDATSTTPVIYAKNNFPGATDVIAVEGFSNTNAGRGIGVSGTGGFIGIKGYANGSSAITPSIGIHGSASGTAGTRIGVYGEAFGGTINWAGYFIGNGFFDGKVGIGSTTPLAKLHIQHLSTISNPQVLLYESDSTEYARLTLQNSSGSSFWSVAGYNSAVNSNELLNFYNSTTGDIMSLTGNGKVGIGTTNPSQKLTVFNGTSTGTYTTTGWMHTSDERLKTNIRPLENSLDKILNLEGVSYNWKTSPTDNNQIGFIAQEVEKVFPEVIVKDAEGNYSMAPQNLTAPIIEAIKEQQKQIVQKDEAIKDLQSMVGSLQNDKELQQQQINELKSSMKNFENALSQCCMNYEQKSGSAGKSKTDFARLEQNIPNPFSENTIIKFYIPQSAQNGQLKIYSSEGSELKSIPVSTKGFGQVEISGNSLSPGTYSYMLFLDGKVIDTKQMILTK